MLIGVGDDGHIGSLYPGGQEVPVCLCLKGYCDAPNTRGVTTPVFAAGREQVLDESGRWVLPVDKKTPSSISLSRAPAARAALILGRRRGSARRKSLHAHASRLYIQLRG